MAKQKMNAQWIKSLQPADQRLQIFDTEEKGLCLRVTPAGIKTWSVCYKKAGRMLRYTLGLYPAISLAEARTKAHDITHDVAHGKDPQVEKLEHRRESTFADLAEQYLEANKRQRSIREKTRIVNIYLNPKFKNHKMGEVHRKEIGSLLQSIAADAPIMANRVLAVIRNLYAWAIKAGILESTPCVNLGAPGEEQKRTRTLTDEEIRKVWTALDNESSGVADVYKIRLLTAQRGGEVMGMAWSEIDLQQRLWTIPAERSKNKKAHTIWLSDPVMEILNRRLQENNKRTKRAGGPSKWVFAGKRKGKHLTEPKRVFAEIAKAAKLEESWTGHDLRRTAATCMTRDLKISRFHVGRVLNHAEKNDDTTGLHYDHYDYKDEIRDALKRWGQRLMVVTSGLKEVKKEAGA